MLLVLGIALVGWAVVGQPGLAAAAGLAMLLVMLAHLRTSERRTTTYEQRMRTNKRYRKLRHARASARSHAGCASPRPWGRRGASLALCCKRYCLAQVSEANSQSLRPMSRS